MIHVFGPQRDRLKDVLQLYQVGCRIRPVWRVADLPTSADARIAFAMIANDPNPPTDELLAKIRDLGAMVMIVSLTLALDKAQRADALNRAISIGKTLQ